MFSLRFDTRWNHSILFKSMVSIESTRASYNYTIFRRLKFILIIRYLFFQYIDQKSREQLNMLVVLIYEKYAMCRSLFLETRTIQMKQIVRCEYVIHPISLVVNDGIDLTDVTKSIVLHLKKLHVQMMKHPSKTDVSRIFARHFTKIRWRLLTCFRCFCFWLKYELCVKPSS